MSTAASADTNAHSVDPSTVTAVGTSSGEPSKLAPSTTTTPAPDAGAGTAKEAVVAEKSAAAKREGGTAGVETPTKVKRRKGFWAQIVGACVPCISAEGHDTTPDSGHKAIARRQPPSEQSSLDQKEKDKNRRSTILPVDASISTTLDAAGNALLADTVATGPARDPTPEPRDDMDQDADVVVPPNANAHHTLPEDETGGVTAGAVQAPGQTETDIAEDMDDEEDRLILNGGMGIPIGPDGQPQPLLPKLFPQHEGRKCLVLDLDETLVHSSFRMIPQADYVIPVLIEHQLHNVYVVKRPGVDQFLEKMGELYEVVVFTASLSMYADPVLDKLDIHKAVTHRLFREHCYNHKGVYVKDLSQLGRPIEGTIILDNSPASYIFHPNNAVPVSSWFSDPHDTELTDMCPFLDDLRHVDDVRGVLDGGL